LTQIRVSNDNIHMSNQDILAKLIAPYEGSNLWLVLNKERNEIVGKGKTLVEALTQAKKAGVEKPSVIKASLGISKFIGIR